MTENNKEENTKKFEETDLEKVDGGYAPALDKAKLNLDTAISAVETEKQRVAVSDSDFRKVLAEHGIDEDKIKKNSRTRRFPNADFENNNNNNNLA